MKNYFKFVCQRQMCWGDNYFGTFKTAETAEEFQEVLEKAALKISQGCQKTECECLAPHASLFKNGIRRVANAVQSDYFFLDCDDPEVNPHKLYEEKIKGHEDELGISYIEESYSGKTSIIGIRPEGYTIAQAQAWLAAKLGIEFDTHCKDLARCKFLTGRTIYNNYAGALDGTLKAPKAPVIKN